jgi:excisionase family DNA binding protein
MESCTMGNRNVRNGTRHRGVAMPEQLMTVEEVAAYLRLSPGTLYNLRYQGRGPKAVRLGNGSNAHLRFRRSDIEAWVEQHSDRRKAGTGA